MTKTQNIILKMYVINFPIYKCHQIPDEYIVPKQPPVMFFKKMFLKILIYSQENTCIGALF